MPEGVSTGTAIPEIVKLGVLALLDDGQDCTAIAKKSNIHRKTVAAIRDDKELRDKYRNSETLASVKKRLLGRQFRNAHLYLDNITEDKLRAASAYQLAGMSALSITKGLEMENQGKGHTLNFTVLLGSSYQTDPHGKVIDVTPGKQEVTEE